MVEGLALSLSGGFETQELIPVGIALGFGVLLIRGSAAIWLLSVLGVTLQMFAPLFAGEPLWRCLTSLFVLVCLCSASVRDFVWRERDHPPTRAIVDAPYAGFGWLHATGLQLKDRLVQREPIPSVSGSLIWRLIFILFISVPLVGKFADYRDGDGRGLFLVEIGWRIVWISFNLLQVGIVIVLLISLYNRFVVRPQAKALDQ